LEAQCGWQQQTLDEYAQLKVEVSKALLSGCLGGTIPEGITKEASTELETAPEAGQQATLFASRISKVKSTDRGEAEYLCTVEISSPIYSGLEYRCCIHDTDCTEFL
jgi:hypothetical protein